MNIVAAISYRSSRRPATLAQWTKFQGRSRRRCAVVMWLLAIGPAHSQTLPISGGGTVKIGQRGADTTVTVHLHGRTGRAILPPGESIYEHALRNSTLIGAIDSRVIVISSDYESNPAGGSYQCGAGTETMVRVIALRPIPHQTFSQLVASCWLVIEGGGISWLATTRTLTIDRTSFRGSDVTGHTDSGGETRTTYRVSANGAVVPVRVEHLQ